MKILITLYIIVAAALFAALMYDLRRDLRLWSLPTALMFAIGLAVLCALWPLVAIIRLVSTICTRRKGAVTMTKHETIEDIIAEMCSGPIPQHRHDRELLRNYADRLWVVRKREKAAIEADALAVGGIVAATTEKSSPVGDAAKLREALVQCELFLGYVSRHGHPTLNPGDKCTACGNVDELRGMVVRALAKPPRNCDVMSLDTARKVWFVHEIVPRLNGDLPLGKEVPFEEWFVSQQKKGESK